MSTSSPKKTLTGTFYILWTLIISGGWAAICLGRLTSLAKKRGLGVDEYIAAKESLYLLGFGDAETQASCARSFKFHEDLQKFVIGPLMELEEFFYDVVGRRQMHSTLTPDANKFFAHFNALLAGVRNFPGMNRPLLTRFDPAAFAGLERNWGSPPPGDFRELYGEVYRNQKRVGERLREEVAFAAFDQRLQGLLAYERLTGISSEVLREDGGIAVRPSVLDLRGAASQRSLPPKNRLSVDVLPSGPSGTRPGPGEGELLGDSPAGRTLQSHLVWARQLRDLLACGSVSFLDLRLLSLVVFKMFFFGVLEPGHATAFFEHFFAPLLAQPLPAEHPLVAFLLAHGKLADRLDAWAGEAAFLRASFAGTVEQPTEEHFAAQRRREARFLGLVVEFAGRFESLVEASWALFNAQLAGNFSARKFGRFRFRFEVGRAAERLLLRNLKAVLRVLYQTARGPLADLGEHVVAVLEENRLYRVAHAIEELRREFGKLEDLAGDLGRAIANYNLLRSVGPTLRQMDGEFDEARLLKFLAGLHTEKNVLLHKHLDTCADLYRELDEDSLFFSLTLK